MAAQQSVVEIGSGSYARTYLEQSNLRSGLHGGAGMTMHCVVGATGVGYHRLIAVVAAFVEQRVAFERKPHFIADKQEFILTIAALQVQLLAALPLSSSMFQFVVRLISLQHLDNSGRFGQSSRCNQWSMEQGYSQVAQQLVLSERTMIRYVKRMSEKRDVTDGGDALVSASMRYAAFTTDA